MLLQRIKLSANWKFNFVYLSGTLCSSPTLRFAYCRYTPSDRKLIILQIPDFTDWAINFPYISLNIQRKCRHLPELYFISCTSCKQPGKSLGSMQSRDYIGPIWAITSSYNFLSRPAICSGCSAFILEVPRLNLSRETYYSEVFIVLFSPSGQMPVGQYRFLLHYFQIIMLFQPINLCCIHSIWSCCHCR
jgi:hypothetical protein